jgi:predicted aspartyl protease
MLGTRPTVHAAINGTDALFIADSGAFFNTLTPAAAEQLKLRLEPAPFGFSVIGVGGEAHTWLTTVKTFTIFNLEVPKVTFLVAGNDLGDRVVGLLGQNVFRLGDTEYDLANGAIRILRPQGDCKRSGLAYWANSEGKPYSVIDIDFASAARPHNEGTAYVNGQKIRVLFDTGAATSILTLQAAKRAGITPDSPGVTPGGPSYGIGRRVGPSWLAPFASFKIGDEEIRNTRLRIADVALLGVDMLVGADFFLSHRIYVATSQRRLYFTYNGGPVFNLSSPPAPTPQDAAAPAPAAAGTAAPSANEPQDAAAWARRGSASAARHDYEHALADLTRACELAPTESSYFYQRGLVHWSSQQYEPALADFGQALKLAPDDVPALMARARLRAAHDEPGTELIADLEAADRAAPKEADERLQLGDLDQYAGVYPAAVSQYSRWIDSHNRAEIQMPRAMNSRCWARALSGQESTSRSRTATARCGSGPIRRRCSTAAAWCTCARATTTAPSPTTTPRCACSRRLPGRSTAGPLEAEEGADRGRPGGHRRGHRPGAEDRRGRRAPRHQPLKGGDPGAASPRAFCLIRGAPLESPAPRPAVTFRCDPVAGEISNPINDLRFRCRASVCVRTSTSMPPCGVSSAPARRPASSPSCAAASSTRSPPRSASARRPRPSSGT